MPPRRPRHSSLADAFGATAAARFAIGCPICAAVQVGTPHRRSIVRRVARRRPTRDDDDDAPRVDDVDAGLARCRRDAFAIAIAILDLFDFGAIT